VPIKRKGKGSYANDRPPILSLISRSSHEVRYWVLEHADKPTTRTIIEGNVLAGNTILYTDEASNYPGVHVQHASVCHSVKEWAPDDGDAGIGLRTFLRTFRGVHNHLADYVGDLRNNGECQTHHPDRDPAHVLRRPFVYSDP
jgi:transposase